MKVKDFYKVMPIFTLFNFLSVQDCKFETILQSLSFKIMLKIYGWQAPAIAQGSRDGTAGTDRCTYMYNETGRQQVLQNTGHGPLFYKY